MDGTVPSETSSCQIPKEEEGPPTLVLEKPVVEEEKPPDPTPGFMRMPTFWEVLGKAWPMRSSWDTELLMVVICYVFGVKRMIVGLIY